jgi:hypothetical protein
MAFPSSITDIVTATLESRSKVIADNVTKNNAFLSFLKSSGNVKTISGGSQILQELSFAENGNFGWYSGYDLLPVAAQDVISAASFTMKQAATPVVVSGLEQLQNSGKEAVLDLLEARMGVAEATMANKISEGIYSDGTGSGGKTITGLQAALKAVATASQTGSYGGIDRATWAFWRNQYNFTVSATPTAAQLLTAMNQLWAACVRGSDRPKYILADNSSWALYIASLQNVLRVMTDQTSGADMGFPSVDFMGSKVVMDGGIGGFMPTGKMYFINPKYFFYRPHKDRNMVPLTPGRRVAINQDAEVQILAWAGNMTCSNLSLQGVLNFATS